jgi:hypothetical protein
MFYKDNIGNYFQGSGNYNYEEIDNEPYSAPCHETVFSEENQSYVLINCGNFIVSIQQTPDPYLANPAYYINTNGDGSGYIVF